ncbi:sensor histidine kinase [Anaerosporobacter faecicola]|uniref:sensor histidine kinase n=1 Tax=Anaerosporobacter faecicola TaxID=2718714 RepID=UPI0014394DA0|nr:sensor histidine kinase [Anaerosporobacter faecicola]
MKLGDFLKDKLFVLLLQLAGMLALTCFLRLVGNSYGVIFLILTAWVIGNVFVYGVTYIQRKKYFQEITQLLDELDKRYLIGEVMPKSYRIEDQLYRQIIKKSNKDVIEKINELNDAKQDYKEYIEGWVHEVKTPLAYLTLYGANHKEQWNQTVTAELNKIDTYIDMVLYYARLDSVYKDYLIQKMDLAEVVKDTISKNKPYLRQNQVRLSIAFEETIVSSDAKWIAFILNQIIRNAVQYRRKEGAAILFSTEERKDCVVLTIEDNGVGIKEEELGRIFDKGFTGSNGRKDQSKATGIGLYLCQKLSERIGIRLQVESKEGEYTRIHMLFPRSSLFE